MAKRNPMSFLAHLAQAFFGDPPSRRSLGTPMRASEYRPRDRYEKVKQLHSGAEGSASVCRSRRNGKIIVAKHLRRDLCTSYPDEAKVLLETLRPHANISRLFGAEPSWLPGRYVLVLPYCSGGDLMAQIEHFARLSSQDYGAYVSLRYSHSWAERLAHRAIAGAKCLVPEVFLLHVLVSLTEALGYIHHGFRRNDSDGKYYTDRPHIPVIHCDIKPANILLNWRSRSDRRGDGMPDVILADFGCAQEAARSVGIGTTPCYAPPEVQNLLYLEDRNPREFERQADRRVMTEKSDMFMLAQVMHTMTTYSRWEAGDDPRRFQLPPEYPSRLRPVESLISQCFEVAQSRRPSADDLLPFMREVRKECESISRKRGPLPSRVWKQPG